jgi:hypothetical protein
MTRDHITFGKDGLFRESPAAQPTSPAMTRDEIIEQAAKMICCPRGCQCSPNDTGECISYQVADIAGRVVDYALKTDAPSEARATRLGGFLAARVDELTF